MDLIFETQGGLPDNLAEQYTVSFAERELHSTVIEVLAKKITNEAPEATIPLNTAERPAVPEPYFIVLPPEIALVYTQFSLCLRNYLDSGNCQTDFAEKAILSAGHCQLVQCLCPSLLFLVNNIHGKKVSQSSEHVQLSSIQSCAIEKNKLVTGFHTHTFCWPIISL